MTTIILDTETTGREPAKVIELAYAELLFPSLQAVDDRWLRFKPLEGSCYGALATHHIFDEELIDKPPSATAWRAIPAEVTYIVGHNIDYDWKALGSNPAIKRICTLAIARSLYPEVNSHKLGAMLYKTETGVLKRVRARKLLDDAHSARADMLICAMILRNMLIEHNLSFNTPEDLWVFSERCRIPKSITFGKYKGTLIKDLPRDYKQWMLRQPEMDPYVVKAVRDTL